jgi:hypothetical protein
MAIHVTPIPRLTTLTTPAFTLGTTNTAGSAITAVASNSTLLAFDGVVPANVTTASAAGSAVVSARRDHVHGGQENISARVTHDAAQDTTSGSEMSVAFNTSTFDTDSMTGTANRLTFTTAGTYLVQAYVQIEANAAGRRHLALRLNGTGDRLAVVQTAPSISEGWGNQVAVLVAVSATNWIEVRFLQTSGATLEIQAANGSPWLSAVKILG